MKKTISILLLLSCWAAGYTQIENEIKNFEDVASTQVANGRKLLIKTMSNENWSKVSEIYSHLNQVAEKEGYGAFTYYEHLYITTLTSQWQEWIKLAKESETKQAKMLFPEFHPIHNELYYRLKQQIETLRKKVIEANLSAEDEEILLIFLHLNKVETPDGEYNKKLRNFKHVHKATEYKHFIKTILPSPRINGIFVYGLGATLIAPDNNLGQTFRPGVGFNMNFAMFLNQLYMASDLNIGDVKTTVDISATNENGSEVDFSKGKPFTLSWYNFRLGYSFVNSENKNITPYLNFGSTQLRSPRFSTESENNTTAEVFSVFNMGIGIRAQFQLSKRQYRTYYGQQMNWHTHFVIDGGYLINTNIKDEVFEGNILYLSAGLVFGFSSN